MTLEQWTSIAGVWGAVLSTLTAIHLIFSSTPIIYPEPYKKRPNVIDDENNIMTKLNLRVFNPSKRSVLQIIRVSQGLGIGNEALRISLLGGNSTEDIVVDVLRGMKCKETGEYLLCLKPEEDVLLQVQGIHPKTKVLMIYWWHRHGLMCRLPKFLWVSWKMANQVNRGRPHA